MKKSLRTLLICIVVLALLGGGYYFAVKWQPDKKADENDAYEESKYLVNIDVENIKSVEFFNDGRTYTIENGEEPLLKGYDSDALDADKISDALYQVSHILISHEIKNTADLSDYGLSNSNKYVIITTNEGKTTKIIVGSSANFENEYFAMTEGGAVCTISETNADALSAPPENYRSMVICDIDNTSITGFSISNNKGKILEITAVESKSDEASEYNVQDFEMSAPYKGVKASSDTVSSFVSGLTSLTANRIVEDSPSDLAKYGLDNPYVLELTDVQGKHKIMLGNSEDDGVYIMYNSLKTVYLAQCGFYQQVINVNPIDFVDRFIHIYNIADVTGIEISDKKDKYLIEISPQKDDTYVCKIDGKKVDEDKFKKLYQAIIGVLMADVTDEKGSGEEVYSIKFTFADKTSKTFKYQYFDERYSVVNAANGLNCLTLTKNLSAITTSIKELKK